jgi:spore maturation protein CgeB
MKIAFFGSSLVSSYWNGEAAYYRGLLKALAALGHEITFYEPDALWRQRCRDASDPAWARVVVYPATSDGWQRALDDAGGHCDLLVKLGNIGIFDAELEQAVPAAVPARGFCAFWDVDAATTLEAIAANPAHHLRQAIPLYDLILTCGGGDAVIAGYTGMGARQCVPVYHALDPATHYPVRSRSSFWCDLSFLANRLPDRETRVDAFFVRAATILRHHRFLLGGAGWHGKFLPPNARCVGHIGTDHHNAFFCSGLATLNINRASMARCGSSPPTRIFEAAGAAACLITDAWDGIEQFLEPGREVLVAADGGEVAELVAQLTPDDARHIASAARRRVLAHHTYERRALQVDALLTGVDAERRGSSVMFLSVHNTSEQGAALSW